MDIKILEANDKTAWLFSRLFYEKHIFTALPDHWKDIWGIHGLLQEIACGNRTVVGFFDNGDFLGCVHGVLAENIFTAHLAFKRKVNVVDCVLKATPVLKAFFADKGQNMLFIDGYICADNRAALRTARLYGANCIEKNMDLPFYWDGKKIPVWHFRKEIK